MTFPTSPTEIVAKNYEEAEAALRDGDLDRYIRAIFSAFAIETQWNVVSVLTTVDKQRSPDLIAKCCAGIAQLCGLTVAASTMFVTGKDLIEAKNGLEIFMRQIAEIAANAIENGPTVATQRDTAFRHTVN